MDVSVLAWSLTIGAIILMLTVDFVGHVRTPHAPSLKEATWWSLGYIVVALLFGAVVWGVWGSHWGTEYYTGYIIEKALSVDNLFVFVLIMAAFKVPRIYQQKVLLVGIVLALIFRTIFILLGKAAVEQFSWVFYIFGAFLIWTAIAQVRSKDDSEDGFEENRFLKIVQRILPTTTEYVGDKLTARIDGKRMVTPMLIVMVAIGSTDVLFALDSIPAIYGITEEVYLIFAANAFSLLGLRQLFFLVDGLLDRLVYLNYGLAAILGWIGLKQILHALHENELSFINGGKPVTAVPVIETNVSLLFILFILIITTVLSLTVGKRKNPSLPAKKATDK